MIFPSSLHGLVRLYGNTRTQKNVMPLELSDVSTNTGGLSRELLSAKQTCAPVLVGPDVTRLSVLPLIVLLFYMDGHKVPDKICISIVFTTFG